jgi:ferritin-like metal-binding protein YciE
MKQTTKNKNQSRQTKNAASEKNRITKRSNQNGSSESLLEKFFIDQLKDVYYAEHKLLKAIPKMAEACTTEELEDAFNEHLKQTERHVKRLEKVFQMIGKKAESKKCEAMEGIVKEAEIIISETKKGSATRDAALIIAAQKVEHYEIATYGGLVQLALTMGLYQVADILDKTLMEEEDTDSILTEIAENYINIEAENEGAYSWEKEEQNEFEESEAEPVFNM